MTEKHTGALALTWTNKHLRLLANDDGTYEWVEPSDYRVAEVRLLNDVKSVGQVHGDRNRAQDNLLIRGDSLHALTSLLRIPEFTAQYEGKVKLVYIDPPFNTGQAFDDYDDGLEHSVWLTMLRDRLSQIKRLLAPNGSVWVHLDDAEQHRARLVLDEVFGIDNFVATFIWQKVDSPNDNKVAVTTDHEFIHCYAKNKPLLKLTPMGDESILGAYGQVDAHGKRYRDRLLKKNGKNSLRADRPTMWFPITDPDGNECWPIHDDGREARWAMGKDAVEALVASNELVWKKRPDPIDPDTDRWVPYTREWAPDTPTRPWPTIWTDVHTSRQAKAHLRAMFPGVTPFGTPKPERLMQRIIEIATESDDIVLDCFAGSGTTAAVAHKMGRRWVTAEWSAENIATYTLPRLEMVVSGSDPGGVTEQVGWESGGGFRVLDVAPSVYEVLDHTVLLSETVTAGQLAESVAAQLGFDYEPNGFFSGAKGRMRLCVVDGVLNDDIARLVTGALQDKERVTVVATACEPGAEDLVRSLAPGSRVRKVPRDLARLSSRRSEVVQLVLDGLEAS